MAGKKLPHDMRLSMIDWLVSRLSFLRNQPKKRLKCPFSWYQLIYHFPLKKEAKNCWQKASPWYEIVSVFVSHISDQVNVCVRTTGSSDRIRKNLLAKSSKTCPAAPSGLTTPGWNIGPSWCAFPAGWGGGWGQKKLPCEWTPPPPSGVVPWTIWNVLAIKQKSKIDCKFQFSVFSFSWKHKN